MLRSFFLSIALMMIAFPAVAMPINGEESMAARCHDTAHATPDDSKHHGSAVKHSCIGCIAISPKTCLPLPSDLTAMSPEPLAMPALIGTFLPPATPPPKTDGK